MSENKKRGRGLPESEPPLDPILSSVSPMYVPTPLSRIAEAGERSRRGINESGDTQSTLSKVPFTHPHNHSTEIELDDTQPIRWLVQVSMTVFQGYFFGPETEAFRLQDELKARSTEMTGTVYMRRMERTQPTDYTTVESVIADIELATPKKK
jgi:hypothetical protein